MGVCAFGYEGQKRCLISHSWSYRYFVGVRIQTLVLMTEYQVLLTAEPTLGILLFAFWAKVSP